MRILLSVQIFFIHGAGLVTAFLLYFVITGVFIFAIRPRKRERPALTHVLNELWEKEPKRDVPDRVKIIADSKDALSVRIALIRAAKESLDITYLSITNGDAGMALLSEAVKAADRGVKVRILVDAKMKILLYSTMRSLARHPQIHIARYNPINILKPWTIHEAMHDKFMVVDRKYAILGGRNIEASYFDLNEPPLANKYDWDVLMLREKDSEAGTSIVDAIAAYSELLWQNQSTKSVRPYRNKTLKHVVVGGIHAAAEEFAKAHPEFYRQSISDFICDMIKPDRIMLLHNPLTNCRKDPWVVQDLAKLASRAKSSVYIQTPYATASPSLLNFLAETADRIDVFYLTNSFASAKNPPAYPNYYFQRRKFLKTGMQIFELQSKDSIHGKAMVLDERISIVGSFNMHSRSVYLDAETMLVIDSPEFTGTFIDYHIKIIEHSLQVGKDNKYIPLETVEEVPVTGSKKLTYFLFYLLLRPLQFFI